MITTHPYEAMCAAGGLISHLAAQGADVEVLAVTDGAEAASGAIDGSPVWHRSRRRGHVLAAYRRLGVPEVRRHRLQLESSKVSDAQPDLVAALSDLVGHDCYPGLWCLAPWRRDGHPDHDGVGLVAEAVCRTYNVRLVRYLCAAWEWLRPEDLPWRRAASAVHAVGQRACTQGRRRGASTRCSGPGVGSRPRVVTGLKTLIAAARTNP